MNLLQTILLGTIAGLLALRGLSGPVQPIASANVQSVEEVKPKKEVPSITHTGRPEENVVQDYVRYAYKISSGDLDFIATLEAENGRRDPHRQSEVYMYYDPNLGKNVLCNKKNWNSQCIREESFGFCQMMRVHHPEVNDKRFRDDPKRQLEQCYRKYKGGTKFYGFNVRHKVIGRFKTTAAYAGKVEVKEPRIEKEVNYYQQAVETEQRKNQLFEQLQGAKQASIKARGECKKSGACKE